MPKKGYKQTPEHIARNSAAQKIAQNRPEVRKKRSASEKMVQKEVQNRPEVKKKNSASRRGKKFSEERKANLRASAKIVQNCPAVRAKQIETRRKNGKPWISEVCRAIIEEAMNRPEVKTKMGVLALLYKVIRIL